MSAPLHGLVLAGGRSSRMGRDKAALDFEGRPQLTRAFQLLEPVTTRCFVSVKPHHRDDPLRAAFPQIVDLPQGPEGPLAGIRAAQLAHPEAAWLVVACDLPLLDTGTLQHLIACRDPARIATAYHSSIDGLPEPLCAIWEPASAGPLAAHVANGNLCARKFLLHADVLLLEPLDPHSLDNINSPADLAALSGARNTAATAAARDVAVQYFALLREQAGRRAETVSTRAATPRDLYAELRERHRFSLAAEHLKVAVNGEFAEWTRPLAAGDAVVFIPPVAGG